MAGVLAAPIYQVSPLMGSNLIIIVFAVVVVGGMGSILGAIVTGYVLGVLEGLTAEEAEAALPAIASRSELGESFELPVSSYSEGPISNPNELGPALKRALDVVKKGEPALVDVVTQPR